MSSFREVQLCGLNILKEVVRVCDENGLIYHLNWGTLLGAVRHKGFIPWDNDIDITMPIHDYRKFLKLAPEKLPDGFFLQTYKSDRGYNEMWAKVRVDGTTALPIIWKNWSVHFGIGIDIFPLLGWYRNPQLRKLQQWTYGLCRTLLAKEYYEAVDSDELRSTNKTLKMILKMPWRVRVFLCDFLGCFIFHKIKSNGNVAIAGTALRGDVPAKLYAGNNETIFEDSMFRIPDDYDTILTQMYGDYMTPPPPEKRGRGHEISFGKIIYDCDKDYREYIAELRAEQ